MTIHSKHNTYIYLRFLSVYITRTYNYSYCFNLYVFYNKRQLTYFIVLKGWHIKCILYDHEKTFVVLFQ